MAGLAKRMHMLHQEREDSGSNDPCSGVLLPPTLTARQRAAVHQAAEEAGLPHESSGDGNERRLTVGKSAVK